MKKSWLAFLWELQIFVLFFLAKTLFGPYSNLTAAMATPHLYVILEAVPDAAVFEQYCVLGHRYNVIVVGNGKHSLQV